MNIDFLHNQIIRDTISNQFIESFNENLVPMLLSEYGSSLSEIQLYEDHLASGFRVNGEFFYPLTLVSSGAPLTRWIKWQVQNYRNYDNFNPFTYKGKKLLDFELVDAVPEKFEEKIIGKPIYSPDGAMPVILTTPSPDKTFLAGKYQQGFVDELSRVITAKIEATLDIGGLSESGVVLEIAFLPGTFMEHVVENTTYRRILIKARGCNARDLWIKWTRLDGEGTYTFSDVVCAGDIEFDLGEDVPGKIREKEYRYLSSESVDKYQAAMSRKNITEWRDMMRRVVRRGEVESFAVVEEKITPEIEDEEIVVEEPEFEVEIEEVVDAVEVLENVDELDADVTENQETDAIADEYSEDVEEAEESDEDADEESDEFSGVDSELVAMLTEKLDKVEEAEEAHEIDSELADLLKSAIGIVAEAAEKGGEEALIAESTGSDEVVEDEAEAVEDIEEVEAKEDAIEDEVVDTPTEEEAPVTEAVAEEASDEEPEEAVASEKAALDPAELEKKLRAELEQKIRGELEIEMKLKADEAAQLRDRLDAQLRQETREKELMAEAALAAIEAQQRLAKQREEEEKQKAEEEARLAEEQRRAEEEARIKAEREAEEARIKEEMAARAKAEAEARIKAEEEAKAQAERDLMGDATYVSKTVRLFFRNTIDSDITKRIHEIILQTIKYFHKEDVYIRIKATIPDSNTVNLQFVKIPEEELPLLVNIVKVLGRSELGIMKATVD